MVNIFLSSPVTKNGADFVSKAIGPAGMSSVINSTFPLYITKGTIYD